LLKVGGGRMIGKDTKKCMNAIMLECMNGRKKRKIRF
jgi:hypothetical protein